MKEFLFGAATAAPQVEGGFDADGKGRTIWDEYGARGLIFNGQTANFACDSYHRLDEDLALIRDLGLNAYRFSIAWTRIQPAGSGALNKAGIDYYNRLIDGLLAIGVTPFVTLFHWDLPLPLWEAGGFLEPSIVDRFAEYAAIVAEQFGDRVQYFSVFNEAAALIDFLYMRPVGGGYDGYRPQPDQTVFRAVHNLLLCNAAATEALRKHSKLPVKVGMVNVTDVKMPKNENDPANVAAAKERMFAPSWLLGNTTFWDPVIFGRYNEALIEKYHIDLSFVQQGDMERIACKPDFLGLNIYLGRKIELDDRGTPREAVPPDDACYGEMGWDIAGSASCMYWGPKFMQERYHLPVYVTETGVSLTEWKPLSGIIHDDMRMDYIRRYFAQLMRAKKEGTDIRGYFVWTLLDNFEWSSGYSRRFGLVYVDHETGERIPKQSFYDYRDMIGQYRKDETERAES